MIVVENLFKKYDRTIALNNVSFSIPNGTILGLLGPNGAGKTTFIRILTGIIIQDSGEIFVNEEKINIQNIKRIGYLPEERGLYKKMKVGEQAIYLACLKGLTPHDAEIRLKEWFVILNILDWWDRKVETLSKGMQQKVQFIISVIHRPDLLILDEPFSGLDPVNQEVLGKQIVNLNKEGTTIVLSTHDMNSVEQFCNQVVLINKGEVVLSGGINEIKHSNCHCIYEFKFKCNIDYFIEECSLFGAGVKSSESEGGIFIVSVQFHNEQDAMRMLVRCIEHISLISFREILPTMNDIFIEYVTDTIK